MEIIMLEDYWYKRKLYKVGQYYTVHPLIGVLFCQKCVAEEKAKFEEDIAEFI